MIAYKVVKKRNRTSISVHKNSKYCLTYEKGTTVKARKNTLGIFCYRTKQEAIFGCNNRWDKIIRVQGIGKSEKPKYFEYGPCSSKELDYFYENILPMTKKFNYTNHHEGIILYQKVKVLE